MFTYPVDVTSHLFVSIREFRWCKCCASHNNILHMFFWLTAHSAFTINLLLHDVPLTIMHVGVLLLNCVFFSLCLSYIITPGIFLHLLMIFHGPGRSVHALVLLSFSMLDFSWVSILWAKVSCFIYFLSLLLLLLLSSSLSPLCRVFI